MSELRSEKRVNYAHTRGVPEVIESLELHTSVEREGDVSARVSTLPILHIRGREELHGSVLRHVRVSAACVC